MLLALLISVPAAVLAAAPNSEQRTLIRTAEAALKKAGNLYRSKKFAQAGDAIKDAQESLDGLGNDPSRELTVLAAPAFRQLAKARELLEAEGIKLPSAKPSAPAEASDKNKVSFTRQIAPLLVARCGNCHIQRSRGELSMGSYVSLSKGSKQGAVIIAGDDKGSRLIEVLESGDMPRGGTRLSDEQQGLIARWVKEGAKFDGPDSAAPLVSFSPSKTAQAPAAELVVVPATGKEEVQFARDVGPLLVAHCTECHGDQNPRANFSVASFSRLLRGGDAGPVIAPGKPAESLLVKKLRGKSGARMPLERTALPEPAIATIEKWIAAKAKFDGSDPALPLEEIVSQVAARNSTHEQLAQARSELAAKNWRLILPDTQPNRQQTADVLLFGTVGPKSLADVARIADEQIEKLRKLFKLSSDRPFIKGGVTLFVFDKRYDYGEVGRMLEHREIPASYRGHWRYTGVDAYGCILLSGDEASPGLVAQQLAGAHVASLGKVPQWFAEGSARAVASKFDSKDPRVKTWDDRVARLMQANDQPADFLSGKLPPEDNDVLSYSYVKLLMTSGTRYASLLAALDERMPFDQAFTKNYGGSPAELIATWVARGGKRGR